MSEAASEPLVAGRSRTPLRPASEEDRLRLKIPGAWAEVMVAVDQGSPLQAVGLDAKGRRQYRYSPEYVALQEQAKFARVRALGQVCDELEQELETRAQRGEEEAVVLLLIRKTGFRVGADRDTKADVQAHGACQLESAHVRREGSHLHFDFVGKKGVPISQSLEDPLLARLIGERLEGSSGRVFSVSDADVRSYLHELAGEEIKVKDLRTLYANELARARLSELPEPRSLAHFRKLRMTVARAVSERLGNTPQVALQSYIDPELFSGWETQAIEADGPKPYVRPVLSGLAQGGARRRARASTPALGLE